MAKRANGEGSIIKRRDGRWQASFSESRDSDGKLKRRYVYGKTKREVLDKLAEYQESARNGCLIAKNDSPSVEEWTNRWLWSYTKNSVKAKTFDQYESICRVHIIPYLGKLSLVKLSSDDCQDLVNAMHEKGLSRRTIELTKTILNAALKLAKKNNLVRNVVTENVVLPKKTHKKARVLSQSEQPLLIEELKENYIGRALLFSLYTGLRRGEVLALTWDDINFNERTLNIEKSLARVKTHSDGPKKTTLCVSTPKTESSNRIVPLIDKAVELLLLHKQEQQRYAKTVGTYYKDINLIFSNSNGGYIDPGNLNRKLNKISKRLGLGTISPHVLRHSFATRGLEAGVSLKAMQGFLGHSSIKITGDIYTHLLEEQKLKEAAKFNDVF